MSRKTINFGKSLALTAALLCLLSFATPARAQYYEPEGFPVTYPWFANAPGESLRQFLYYHPEVSAELSADPELIYNRGWRLSHPELEAFVVTHPDVWTQLTSWGDYDDDNAWHDAYWWHDNNPDWFYESHPGWVALWPAWYNADGDYDENHVWHYGGWWYRNNPGWVSSRHPEWLRTHQAWLSGVRWDQRRAAINTADARREAIQQHNLRERASIQARRDQQRAFVQQRNINERAGMQARRNQRLSAVQQRNINQRAGMHARRDQQRASVQQRQERVRTERQASRQQALNRQQEAMRSRQVTRQAQVARQPSAARAPRAAARQQARPQQIAGTRSHPNRATTSTRH